MLTFALNFGNISEVPFEEKAMHQGNIEHLPVVNQEIVCRKSGDGKWSFDSMMDALDKDLDLASLAGQFREDFLQSLSTMAERSEVRAFKTAYDLLSKRLGNSREMLFSAHVFIKNVGSDAGISIANNGTIYVLKVSQHTASIISKNPPRSSTMPPTVDNPQLNWEPIGEDDLCLVVYNYSAARLMNVRRAEMAGRIRRADSLQAADMMLHLEANELTHDRSIGDPNILLIPLR